jgi:acyl dehydratase
MLGLFLDELHEGLLVPLGSYHFTRENVLAFAAKYDPQPFHLDDEAAKAGPFGALSASGFHTAAAWMVRYVTTNSEARQRLAAAGKPLPEIGPSPGFEDMRWLKPVFPGDRLSYSSRVTGKRELASRPQWGLLFTHNEGVNQNGDLVFSFEGKVLTATRPKRI